MAGESAGAAARRMREKAERLDRAAQLWERGAEGERRTATTLGALPADDWTLFHDVHWPGRPKANIDHVVVGPAGVFVVDSKNWSGRISVDDGALRQNGRGRAATVASASGAALAIRQLLSTSPNVPVIGVLCFVDNDVVGVVEGVVVCSTANVVRMLQARPPVLEPAAREDIVSRLAAHLSSTAAPAPERITLSDGSSIARASRGRASRRGAPRRKNADGGVVSRFVGVALAIGAFWFVLSQTEVVDQLSQAFVSFIADDRGSDPSTDEPSEKPKNRPIKESGR